jgi:hypothetical protein
MKFESKKPARWSFSSLCQAIKNLVIKIRLLWQTFNAVLFIKETPLTLFICVCFRKSNIGHERSWNEQYETRMRNPIKMSHLLLESA